MSDIAIQVENLAKRYRIGIQRGKHESLIAKAASVAAWPVQNFRRLRRLSRFSEDEQEAGDIYWALKDLSFEVKTGEVLGIIGRNGAGKTTLLKILARITEPSRGHARVYGRVGALLEIGTGFHPELTGRENVFLNASVLGMSRAETRRKFDEIVEFSEVEKFIDTPVKRYSTGMMVRLAFSVAAHLEPEILLVDEVLAVGDVAFQRKCLGKTSAVARAGRTVIFVSHNMGTMARLCTRALWIDDGRVKLSGSPDEVIGAYLSTGGTGSSTWIHPTSNCNIPELQMISAQVLSMGDQPTDSVDFNSPFKVAIEYEIIKSTRSLFTGYTLTDSLGNILWASAEIDKIDFDNYVRGPGRYRSTCQVPANIIKPGRYLLSVGCADGVTLTPCYHENVLAFDVSEVGGALMLGRPGIVTPALDWNVTQIDVPVPVPVGSGE